MMPRADDAQGLLYDISSRFSFAIVTFNHFWVLRLIYSLDLRSSVGEAINADKHKPLQMFLGIETNRSSSVFEIDV